MVDLMGEIGSDNSLRAWHTTEIRRATIKRDGNTKKYVHLENAGLVCLLTIVVYSDSGLIAFSIYIHLGKHTVLRRQPTRREQRAAVLSSANDMVHG